MQSAVLWFFSLDTVSTSTDVLGYFHHVINVFITAFEDKLPVAKSSFMRLFFPNS